MKTRNLILTISAAAFAAITLNTYAGDAYLSPRAAQTQIKQVSGTATDVNLVAANATTVSPRAASNQSKTVAGTSNDVNPAIACARNMNGTPKAVAECISHTTMPACEPMAVATK